MTTPAPRPSSAGPPAAQPDPTGVRRLIAACEPIVFVESYGYMALKEALAAVRVAELERVVEAARGLLKAQAGEMLGFENRESATRLHQALAALDLPRGET